MQAHAAGKLVDLGMYFSAISLLDGCPDHQAPLLHRVQKVIDDNTAQSNLDQALQAWLWDDLDRSLLVLCFRNLKLIRQYQEAWHKLRHLGLHGLYNLLTLERQLLSQVCTERHTRVCGWPVDVDRAQCLVLPEYTDAKG